MVKLEKILSKNFVWKIIPARRSAKKGRAKGEFLIGLKKTWLKQNREAAVEIEKGLIKTEINVQFSVSGNFLLRTRFFLISVAMVQAAPGMDGWMKDFSFKYE